MIDPKHQWAIQIDVTNDCVRECSNCTRFVGHSQPFYMSVKQFEEAANALKDFPTQSPPPTTVKHKVVGIIGGEPLLHPQVEEIFLAFERIVPARENRGLWTGLHWEKTIHAPLIQRIFGYVNNNRHNTVVMHSPILTSISHLVPDKHKQKQLIDDCWLQRMWSGTVTPKGFFFCEVAGAFDMLFNGPGGLPVEDGCWSRPITDFQEQIDRWCYGCGVPLQLEGRLDKENIDDITPDNLAKLKDSPRVLEGKVAICTHISNICAYPWRYMQ